jgi:signal transduction histidine kinase
VKFHDLASEVLELHLTEAERDRMHLTVTDHALTVRADASLLKMILGHLIDNALKYSIPGSPVEVTGRIGSNEVLVSVHNIGSIIRIEDRERIFDRFYRSSDLKDSIPGTGIGLSVVKKAAESQHGHVWVISNAEDGTTFYLSLPTSMRRKS